MNGHRCYSLLTPMSIFDRVCVCDRMACSVHEDNKYANFVDGNDRLRLHGGLTYKNCRGIRLCKIHLSPGRCFNIRLSRS